MEPRARTRSLRPTEPRGLWNLRRDLLAISERLSNLEAQFSDADWICSSL